jgi:hypothetical protein
MDGTAKLNRDGTAKLRVVEALDQVNAKSTDVSKEGQEIRSEE